MYKPFCIGTYFHFTKLSKYVWIFTDIKLTWSFRSQNKQRKKIFLTIHTKAICHQGQFWARYPPYQGFFQGKLVGKHQRTTHCWEGTLGETSETRKADFLIFITAIHIYHIRNEQMYNTWIHNKGKGSIKMNRLLTSVLVST